jgi:iron complex outermembrane receptor protein
MYKDLQIGIFARQLLLKSAAICGFFVLVALVPENSALAQEEVALEEIVVTSRRYEESLQDAPVAVSVLTEEYMNNNRVGKADDIMEVTPGATWESFSKMQPVASLRGIIAPTPGNASSEASIQTVADNVVITKDSLKYPTLFDMNRVEVMRGPQGTAFGRNASVGLIHFVSNRPSQGQSGGRVTATYGSRDLMEIDGFFTGAFTDTVSARLAYNFDTHGGDMESASTGEYLDGDSNRAIRASMVVEPSDNFSAYFKLEYSQDRDDAPVRHGYFQPDSQWNCSNRAYVYGRGDTDPGWPDTANPPPSPAGQYDQTWFDNCDNPFLTEISPETKEGFDTYDFHTDRNILTFAAELIWDFDNDLSLTSITGYLDGDTDSMMDLVGTPNDVAYQQVQNDASSISTELRLDNIASDSKIRWMGGIYLMRDEEDRFEQNIFQPRNARPAPPPFWTQTHMGTIANNVTKSYSAFGEINFDIGERATLTYGGRYVNDDKSYLYGVRSWGTNRQIGGVPGVGPGIDGVAAACRPNTAGPPDPSCGSEAAPLGFTDHPVNHSWNDYINKLSLSYALGDSTNIYGLYSEGFKSGTFQPDARSKATADVVVQPETTKNYEAGIKGASERFRYAVTLFYMDVQDVQTINLVPVAGGFTGLISNVGSVETQGIELEGTWLITDNLLVSGTYAKIDAEMKDTLDPTGAIDPNTGVVYDLTGHRPPGAPEYTFTLFGEWTAHLGGGSDLMFRADVRSRSDVFNQTSNRFYDPPLRLRPQVTNWGARVTWVSPSDQWTVAAWGKNINEDIDIENFGPPSPCCSSFSAGFRGRVQYGLTAGYVFGGG